MFSFFTPSGELSTVTRSSQLVPLKELKEVYAGLNDRRLFGLPNPNHPDVKNTYGEILPESVAALADRLAPTPEDVFYDLGSGGGKMVLQMLLNTPVRKSAGIEFMAKRHQMAQQAEEIFRQRYPDRFVGRELSLIEGNIAEQDLSDATIVYLCATCYPEALLEKISILLESAPNLRAIVTLKQHPAFARLRPKMTRINLRCSWSEKSTGYLYE